jgi:hypothetical protein
MRARCRKQVPGCQPVPSILVPSFGPTITAPIVSLMGPPSYDTILVAIGRPTESWTRTAIPASQS